MIAAIERSHFTILFKYNHLRVGYGNVLDVPVDEIIQRLTSTGGLEILVNEFHNILPLFEQDHEVLILEIDKSRTKFGNQLELSFQSIHRIIPLSQLAVNLLYGKLNENLIIEKPIFQQIIEKVKIQRSISNRRNCGLLLTECFGLSSHINEDFHNELISSVTNVLAGKQSNPNKVINELITYDKTPAFLPSGNAEYILKIGLVAMNVMKRDESILKKGPFYQKCIEHKERLNSGGILRGYHNLQELSNADNELRASIEKIREIINENQSQLDLFEISYYYFTIKAHLFKNEKDLLKIAKEIKLFSKNKEKIIAHSLLLIGYTFSIEELYESIHVMRGNPLMKNKFNFKENDANYSQSIELSSSNAGKEYKEISESTVVNETNITSNTVESSHNKVDDFSKSLDGAIAIEHQNITIEWDISANKANKEEPTLTQNIEIINSKLTSPQESQESKDNYELNGLEKEQLYRNESKELKDVKDSKSEEILHETSALSSDQLYELNSSNLHVSVNELEIKISKLISAKKILNNWKKLLADAFPDPLVEVSPQLLLDALNSSKFQDSELFKFGKSNIQQNKELILANLIRD